MQQNASEGVNVGNLAKSNGISWNSFEIHLHVKFRSFGNIPTNPAWGLENHPYHISLKFSKNGNALLPLEIGLVGGAPE